MVLCMFIAVMDEWYSRILNGSQIDDLVYEAMMTDLSYYQRPQNNVQNTSHDYQVDSRPMAQPRANQEENGRSEEPKR